MSRPHPTTAARRPTGRVPPVVQQVRRQQVGAVAAEGVQPAVERHERRRAREDGVTCGVGGEELVSCRPTYRL